VLSLLHISVKFLIRSAILPCLISLPSWIYPTSLQLVCGFFRCHSHCTRHGSHNSALIDISTSVVQGSAIIGPASYVVYSSDLASITAGTSYANMRMTRISLFLEEKTLLPQTFPALKIPSKYICGRDSDRPGLPRALGKLTALHQSSWIR